jgi:hypothetical protein
MVVVATLRGKWEGNIKMDRTELGTGIVRMVMVATLRGKWDRSELGTGIVRMVMVAALRGKWEGNIKMDRSEVPGEQWNGMHWRYVVSNGGYKLERCW